MKKTNSLLLIAIIVIMLLLVFSVLIFKQKEVNTTITTNTTNWETITEDPETGTLITGVCQESDNCCSVDSDCEYIWYTGGCNTPEFVKKIMDGCLNKTGSCPREVPEREGVTCSCESQKCITRG